MSEQELNDAAETAKRRRKVRHRRRHDHQEEERQRARRRRAAYAVGSIFAFLALAAGIVLLLQAD